MTTRTIRETDTIILPADPRATSHGARYYLADRTGRVRHEYAANYAEAIQRRADIIDGRAGQPRVGDIVRIGLKGVQTYAVAEVGEDTLGLAYRDGGGKARTRRVDMDRVHLVEGVR